MIEHISDASFFFAEVYRVLRPGGILVAKTPNKWHYVATIARITPHWFHDFYNRLRGRESHDTFPTTYACNTPHQVERVATSQGFEIIKLDVIEGRPEYLRITFPTYVIGLAYERTVNALRVLRAMRCVLLIQLRKPPMR